MRLQPENRRAVIITAAGKIASERGLHAVTHGDVAKRCVIETSKKTVQHYFPKQADLWRVLADQFPDQAKELGL
jgi:AcrR family transcriptional regulator